MLELFNEIMQSMQLFVSSYFNNLAFTDGISIGWILLTVACIAVVTKVLIGRMK